MRALPSNLYTIHLIKCNKFHTSGCTQLSFGYFRIQSNSPVVIAIAVTLVQLLQLFVCVFGGLCVFVCVKCKTFENDLKIEAFSLFCQQLTASSASGPYPVCVLNLQERVKAAYLAVIKCYL